MIGPVLQTVSRRLSRAAGDFGLAAGVAAAILVASLPCFATPQAETPMPSVQSPRSGTAATRSIVGKVVDESGAKVPGAVVLLKDMQSLQVRSYIVPKDGTYRFYGLSADVAYEVRAQTSEMTSAIKTVSVFDSHKVITVNLKLKKPKRKKKFSY